METRGNTALKLNEHYTYKDLRGWPEDERWELIDGHPFAMSPAPRRRHQRITLALAAELRNKLKGKPFEPYISPIDVFLPEDGWDRAAGELSAIDIVVQPDIVVVCDPDKLIDEGILGAPDFIIEVLSPATAYRDLTEKRELYERVGVREYWTVNPDTLEVHIYLLKDGRYGLPRPASLKEPVPVTVLDDARLSV